MGWVVNATPGHFTSWNDPVPSYRRLGEHHGRYRRVRKIPLLPGFDHLALQLAASCYTVYAVPVQRQIMLSVLDRGILEGRIVRT